MYKVKKAQWFDVVEIDTIERGVHLIPCYGGSLVATCMTTATSLPALEVHDEFFINNQIDLSMYNIIY